MGPAERPRRGGACAAPRRRAGRELANGIGFIPWYPLATGALAQSGGPLAEIAQRTGHTPGQLALAWLLKRSPVTLPIPGTSTVAHLEDNVAAAAVELSDEDFETIAAVV